MKSLENATATVFRGSVSPCGGLAWFCAVWVAWFLPLSLSARTYVWSTLAGSDGGSGFQDGVPGEAKFFQPAAVAFDADGDLLLVESGNHVLRRVSPAGVVRTLAGLGGMAGARDGLGGNARFHSPGALLVRADGVVIVCDTGNHSLRWIRPSGEVGTLAGMAGEPGLADGEAGEARFSSPSGLAAAPDGGVYVADTGNHAIRHVSPEGRTRTVAGWEGLPGHEDGEVGLARFRSPVGLACEADGSLLVADSDNAVIRRISPDGWVSTPAGMPYGYDHADGVGAEAKFVYPLGLAVDEDGMIYVSDPGAEAIRRIHPDTHEVVTLAGEVGESGFVDGSPGRFAFPAGMAVDGQGRLCVADMENHAIRTVDAEGRVGTRVASPPNRSGSQDGPAAAARFRMPFGLARSPDGRIFVADTGNRTLRVISPSGQVQTLAGVAGESGADDGPAGLARFTSPRAVTVDSGGFVYATDWASTSAGTLRRVEPDGTVSTLAGAPGTLPPEETFHSLSGVAALPNGWLAATDISAIRKISPAGVASFLAGSKRSIVQSGGQTITFWKSGSQDGLGAQATFFHPHGVAADPQGMLYVSEFSGCVIRKITPQGLASTLAGSPARAGATLEHRDGIGAAARFHRPAGIAVDLSGNLFVAESGSHTIRMIDPSGKVRTIGGLPGRAGNNSGPGNRALFRSPFGIAVDHEGRLFVADRDNHRIAVGIPQPYTEIQVRDEAGRDLSLPDRWLDFGPAPLGKPGEIQTLRITNQGTADLWLGAPELLGAAAEGFRLLADPPAAAVAPGGFWDLPIQVIPGPAGLRTATLLLSSNDEDKPALSVELRAGLNRPPVFPGYQVQFPIGSPIRIPLAKILAKAHDPDGDSLRISAIGPPEKGVGHASLAEGAIHVNLSPSAASFPAEFTLPVTVADANDALVTGSISVRLFDPASDSAASLVRNPPHLERLAENQIRVSFHGIPGRSYRIERSTDLLHWQFLREIPADARGGIQMIDPSPPQPSAYYRLAPP